VQAISKGEHMAQKIFVNLPVKGIVYAEIPGFFGVREKPRVKN